MKEQLKKADVLGLVLIASALVAYFIRSTWTNYQSAVAGIGAVLVVVSWVLKSNEIREGMGRRSTKFGINSAVSVLLMFGVLAIVNYLGEQHQKRFDMTAERLNSLADESIKVAGELKENVQIKAFYPGAEEPRTRQLLELFSTQNRKISVQFIDPDKQPLAATQYKVTAYGIMRNILTREQQPFGTIILDMGNEKTERIEKQEAVTEEDVTNALMKLVKGEKKFVYFVSGHGEKAIESTDRAGYQVAKGALEKDGYVVKPLTLVREQKIPADASVVVFAGPVAEPMAEEITAVDAYLDGGGSVLLMLDPPPDSASLADFTKKWSVAVGNNRIIDPRVQGGVNPVLTSYGPHKIVEKFDRITAFPLTRSVAPAMPPVPQLTAEVLLESAEDAWGESDMKSERVTFDAKTDAKGPVPIATVVTKAMDANKTARLVVIGDSDFAANGNFGNPQLGNGNLLLNTVKWLARDENLISIKVKNPADRPLEMTESGGRTVTILLMVLFPGAVLFAGVFVWVRRRKS